MPILGCGLVLLLGVVLDFGAALLAAGAELVCVVGGSQLFVGHVGEAG